MSFYFVGFSQADNLAAGFVAVVLRGEFFRRGKNFAEFLASVSLQDDSITMLAFNFVDVAEDCDPAELSVADEVSVNTVVDVRGQ